MSNLNYRRVANGWIRPRAFPSSLFSTTLVHSSAVTSRLRLLRSAGFPRSVGDSHPMSLPRSSAFPLVGWTVASLSTTATMTARRRADTSARRRRARNRPTFSALRRGDVDNRRRGEHSSIQNGRRCCAGATRITRTHAREKLAERTLHCRTHTAARARAHTYTREPRAAPIFLGRAAYGEASPTNSSLVSAWVPSAW